MMPILKRSWVGLLTVSCTFNIYPSYFYSNKPRSWNHGQACCAGTRIFVQEGIYDKFLEKFTEKAKTIKLGDPFGEGVDQGPQVSEIQFDVRSILEFF